MSFVSGGISRAPLAPQQVPDLSSLYEVQVDGALGFRNKFINGIANIAIAQRGYQTTVAASTAAFVADRWLLTNTSNQTLTVSVFQGLEGRWRIAFWFTVAPTSGFVEIAQKIENVKTLNGRKATLSYSFNSPENMTVTSYAAQVFGTGGSPAAAVAVTPPGSFQAGSIGWKKVIHNYDLPSVAGKALGTDKNDYLVVAMQFPIRTTGECNVRELQFEEGSIATPYEERPDALELLLCQRYFTAMNFYGTNTFASKVPGDLYLTNIHLPVPMRAQPAKTFLNPSQFAWYNPAVGWQAFTPNGVRIASDNQRGAILWNLFDNMENQNRLISHNDPAGGWLHLSAEL